MNSQRIEQLKSLIREEPSDPFYVYALALELVLTNRAESIRLLNSLLAHHSNYLPTYYQVSFLLIDQGDDEKAKPIIEKGIVLAKQQNEMKTLSELQSMLDSI
jgi:hypothetical protein